MLVKELYWKLIEDTEFRELKSHGPYYDDFKLNDGPFETVGEAEEALTVYFLRYEKEYESLPREEFALITVYSHL